MGPSQNLNPKLTLSMCKTSSLCNSSCWHTPIGLKLIGFSLYILLILDILLYTLPMVKTSISSLSLSTSLLGTTSSTNTLGGWLDPCGLALSSYIFLLPGIIFSLNYN